MPSNRATAGPGLGGIESSEFQLNVCAKSFTERFIDFLPTTPSVGHGLFDADDLVTSRTLAEAVTGTVHFAPWSESINGGQFWLSHTLVSARRGAALR